jgi:hypothetical protein
MVIGMTTPTPSTSDVDTAPDLPPLADLRTEEGSGRSRRRHSPGRTHRLTPKFTAEELAEIATTAENVGMTPTGFCADSAISAARGTPLSVTAEQDREELKRLQRQLFAARTAVNRFGTNVNQIATRLNATGEAPEWMGRAMALVGQSIRRLDEVIAEVHRKLR